MAKALPDEFPPAERSHSLYEGIEYQAFWREAGRDRLDALERYLLTDLLPASGRRIIDLGCGYGRLAPCYVNRFDQVVLCDGSLSLLRDAHGALGDKAILVAADLARLPFMAASFDCVLTIRVLHHVHDLEGVLDEVRRVIAGNGRLVFSYHNKRHAKRILTHAIARGAANPFSREPVELEPTLISRHPSAVDTAIGRAGFSQPDYQGTAIVKSVANMTDKLRHRAPAGAGWAPFMGRFRLAPWLIGTSFAQGHDRLREPEAIDQLFCCPSCRGDLARSGAGFGCPICRRLYRIDDGIVDFRL